MRLRLRQGSSPQQISSLPGSRGLGFCFTRRAAILCFRFSRRIPPSGTGSGSGLDLYRPVDLFTLTPVLGFADAGQTPFCYWFSCLPREGNSLPLDFCLARRSAPQVQRPACPSVLRCARRFWLPCEAVSSHLFRPEVVSVFISASIAWVKPTTFFSYLRFLLMYAYDFFSLSTISAHVFLACWVNTGV
jgi:hypothetical protein